MSSYVGAPESDELAQTLEKLGDTWSRERRWEPQLAGLFVKTSDGKGRVYFSSEPGLFVQFELDAVERYVQDATRVVLKPDRYVTFSLSWTDEVDSTDDDEFALRVTRSPEGPPVTHFTIHAQMRSAIDLLALEGKRRSPLPPPIE